MLYFYTYRTEILFLKNSVFFPKTCKTWEHKLMWTLNHTHEKKQELKKITLKDKYFFINDLFRNNPFLISQ